MRLLACLIVAPQRGYDEPAILSYAISSFCPTSADGLQPGSWVADALRHRCKVMTLTPSVRAISLCSFPCVARSFACASFDAISTLEYLFFLAIAASLRPANVIAACWNVIGMLKSYINGPYKERVVGSGTRNQIWCGRVQIGDCLKKTDRLAIAKKSRPMATFAAPHD